MDWSGDTRVRPTESAHATTLSPLGLVPPEARTVPAAARPSGVNATFRCRAQAGWRWIVSTSLLTSFWLLFFEANIKSSVERGRPIGVGAMLLEIVVATLFVLRRQPFAVSRSPVAWLAATAGSFGVLAARPDYEPVGGLGPAYVGLQLLGSLLAIASLLALGRAFGIVAANRGIRSGGPYRLVRHPTYASYLLVIAGYLLESPSIRNCVIVGIVVVAQLVRIRFEEEQLSADPAYRAYRERVRHRLVPFVY